MATLDEVGIDLPNLPKPEFYIIVNSQLTKSNTALVTLLGVFIVNHNINMAAVDHHLQSELQSLRIEALSHRLKGFLISKHTFNDEQCFILTHEKLYDHPPLGPTSRVRIIIKGNEYVVHVLLREIQRGMLPVIDAETQVLEIFSKFSLDSPIYRFCSGQKNMKKCTKSFVLTLRVSVRLLLHSIV